MTGFELSALVRSVPDFPRPGILFRDVTTLIAHGEGFAQAVDELATHAERAKAEIIAGIEARGFIFGAAVAARMGLGFLPVRKAGKLPVPAIGEDYALEYGTDRLEIDPDALRARQRVVLIDDLVATGGTARAAASLISRAGASVAEVLCVIDLPDIGGSQALRSSGLTVHALMEFEGH